MRLIDADALLEQMKGMNMLFSPKIVIDNMPTVVDCEKCETDQWDALYKAEMKGRADGIDAFFKALNRDNLIRNENDLIIASMLAEQLKEQKK